MEMQNIKRQKHYKSQQNNNKNIKTLEHSIRLKNIFSRGKNKRFLHSSTPLQLTKFYLKIIMKNFPCLISLEALNSSLLIK